MISDRIEPRPGGVAVIGGGAAGFFAALTAAEALRDVARAKKQPPGITIFEANRRPLNKVRISGGGRCNLTHACFDARELVEHYPRGGRALKSVFARFQPRDTIEWFRARGVETKTEADGRMFPISDDSATIVECLLHGAKEAGIDLRLNCGVAAIQREPDEAFRLIFKDGTFEFFDRVLLAAGGSAQTFQLAENLGHRIVSAVPSIFTFAINDARIKNLPGLAVENAEVRLPSFGLSACGPLLITHWGLSGPAILRLSAFGARELFAHDYQAELRVNWRAGENENTIRAALLEIKKRHGARLVAGESGGLLPSRLWRSLCLAAGVSDGTWAQLPGPILHRLVQEIAAGDYRITGKGVFKDEFVTAGGVELSEVDFRTMQSRIVPGLFFAGEILDIDGVTGGFNFQNAWSTGWLAGRGLVDSVSARD